MLLSPLNLAKAAIAFGQIVRDPNQLGKVFELRAALESKPLLDKVIGDLKQDELARKALVELPRVGKIDLAALSRLPEGTLGHEFALHMKRANLDPSALPALEAHDAYGFVSAHLYETHDIWHAITGFGADIPGELGLQAFYYAQFSAGLSAAILAAGFLNTMLYSLEDRFTRMDAIVLGYAMGRRANKLFGFRWAEHWHRPLADVRADLGIVPTSVSSDERAALAA